MGSSLRAEAAAGMAPSDPPRLTFSAEDDINEVQKKT